MTWPVLHISQTIEADLAAVLAIAGKPEKLPLWAAGLSAGIRRESGRWLSDSPMGTVEVRFIGPVAVGILDHDVTLPDGAVIHNPLRVLRNGEGSEVVFSIFQRRGMTDDRFRADAALVREDLSHLKKLVENG